MKTKEQIRHAMIGMYGLRIQHKERGEASDSARAHACALLLEWILEDSPELAKSQVFRLYDEIAEDGRDNLEKWEKEVNEIVQAERVRWAQREAEGKVNIYG